jgi:hypothetical protein
MDLDLARDFYFRELDGKAQQDTRMGVYVALFSVLGGALAFLVRAAWSPPRTLWCYLSLIAAVLSLVLYFVAIIWVLRAAIGFTYERLPSLEDILAYRQKLASYYASNPSVPDSAAMDFDDFMTRHFASAAARNARNNLARSARFYRAAQLLLWVVVLAAVAALALAANRVLPAVFLKGT